MALLKAYRRAPAIAAGAFSAFLALLPARTNASNLAEQLLTENRPDLARAEARRALIQDPENAQAGLTALKAGILIGKDLSTELSEFASNENNPKELRAEAHSELAGICERNKDFYQALKHLVACFNTTESSALFASSTREANRILNENPDLEETHPQLVNIIRTSSAVWPRVKRTKEDAPSILSRPALWAIALYRSQISPAIGARCSLTPSCSQYAVNALRQYGVLGLALAGDRMVREPDVVTAKEVPIVINKQIKYADPVSAHTFWFREKK